MHCLLCATCPACDVVLLNALLCVHGAHAWILSCGVLLMLACSCRFSLTTLAGLHVPMLFEWCVQAFPSGHVGPRATAGNKRREGRDCTRGGGGMGGAIPKRWRSVWCMWCVIHVSARLCRRAACLCRTHMAFARLRSTYVTSGACYSESSQRESAQSVDIPSPP